MQETAAEIHANLVRDGLADCDRSCLCATDDKCTCACGGKNHGRDVKKMKARLEYLNKRPRGEIEE